MKPGTGCSALHSTVSNWSALLVNGNPQGSTLPFSLCAVSLEINGFAAVWEGCRGGSFDSAQTPFGIKRRMRCGGQSLVLKSRLQLRQTQAVAAGKAWQPGTCVIAQLTVICKDAHGGIVRIYSDGEKSITK